MKVFDLFFLVTFSLFIQKAFTQNEFSDIYFQIEIDPSSQVLAKKKCIEKGIPLSLYVENVALIEAFTLEDDIPMYGVITDFLNPTNGGALMAWEEVQKEFDLSNAHMNYGNGNFINERTINALTNPTPGQILLIPESSNDRVMAFDAVTGDLINADFIPADNINLSTPLTAIPLVNTNNYLVSDQLDDAIQLYDNGGSFLSTFFGGNTTILDNVRGITLKHDFSSVLASIGSGANINAIAEFDLSGNYVGNFIGNGVGGLNSPFDIEYSETLGNYLVAGINSDQIHEFDSNGNSIGIFANVNTFPEQITELPDGRIGVGNFSGSQEGVLIYSSTGVLLHTLDPPTLGGYRGVYELGNGNILTTNGGGVHEIDYSGNLVSTKMTGVSARFIHEGILPATIAEKIPTISQWGLFLLCLLLITLGIVIIRDQHSIQTNLID